MNELARFQTSLLEQKREQCLQSFPNLSLQSAVECGELLGVPLADIRKQTELHVDEDLNDWVYELSEEYQQEKTTYEPRHTQKQKDVERALIDPLWGLAVCPDCRTPLDALRQELRTMAEKGLSQPICVRRLREQGWESHCILHCLSDADTLDDYAYRRLLKSYRYHVLDCLRFRPFANEIVQD